MNGGPEVSLTPSVLGIESTETEVSTPEVPSKEVEAQPKGESSLIKLKVPTRPIKFPIYDLTSLSQEDQNVVNSSGFRDFILQMNQYKFFDIGDNKQELLALFKNQDTKMFKVLSSEQGLAAANAARLLGARFESLSDFRALDTLLSGNGPNSTWESVSPEHFDKRVKELAVQLISIKKGLPPKHPLNSRSVKALEDGIERAKDDINSPGISGFKNRVSGRLRFHLNTLTALSNEFLPSSMSAQDLLDAAKTSDTGQLDFSRLLDPHTLAAINRTLESTAQDYHPTTMAMLRFDTELLEPLSEAGIERGDIPRLTELLDSLQSSILGMDPSGLGQGDAERIMSVVDDSEFMDFANKRLAKVGFEEQPLSSFKQLADLVYLYNISTGKESIF